MKTFDILGHNITISDPIATRYEATFGYPIDENYVSKTTKIELMKPGNSKLSDEELSSIVGEHIKLWLNNFIMTPAEAFNT